MSVYCVTSAGYYVQLERDQRNEHYSYKEYLDALRAGVQEQSEELLAEENRNYSQTLNFALDMCVNQQASNHNLYRVCDYKGFVAFSYPGTSFFVPLNTWSSLIV